MAVRLNENFGLGADLVLEALSDSRTVLSSCDGSSVLFEEIVKEKESSALVHISPIHRLVSVQPLQ